MCQVNNSLTFSGKSIGSEEFLSQIIEALGIIIDRRSKGRPCKEEFTMPKWLVRLKGERFDLEDFPKLLRSPEVRVVEENGSFYLESSEFNSLTLAEEVRGRGRALIKLINGVAKFYRNNFLGISEDAITRVEDNGKRHNYVFLEGAVTFRTTVRGQLTGITTDRSEKVATQPSALESLLEVAQKHNVVADALSFYRDDTWISLYKAYEIIRGDVGGEHQIIKNGWTVKSGIKRFTQTAQPYRHASKKYKPPAQPMTLLEARALIKTILSRWVSSNFNKGGDTQIINNKEIIKNIENIKRELEEKISLANEGMLTLDKTKTIFHETNGKMRNILPENSIPYLKFDSLMSKRTAWWTEDEHTGKYISKGGSNYQHLIYLQEAIGEVLKKIKVVDNISNNNQESNKIEENIKRSNIFLSYSHKDEEIADGVDNFFISKNIQLTRDVRDAMPYSSLKKFMDTIRDHDYVIMLISDAYLKSTNCMYEVIQFIQEKKYIEKTFPIIIDNKADIFKKEKHIDYIKFWQNKYKGFKDKINNLENTGTAQSHVELDKIDKIQSNIGDFLNKIADLKCFSLDELENTNYKAILDKIGNTFKIPQKEEI